MEALNTHLLKMHSSTAGRYTHTGPKSTATEANNNKET